MSTNETERDENAAASGASDTGTNDAPAAPTEAPPAEAEEASAKVEATEAAPTDAPTDSAAEPAEASPPKAEAAGDSAPKAEPAVEPAKSVKAASSPSRPSAESMSPGQRIAAQKAAKAAKKATDKARRAEDAAKAAEDEVNAADLAGRPTPSAPDAVELRAAEVSSIVQKNSDKFLRAVATAAVIVAMFFGARAFMARSEHAAGALLGRAVDASRAEIGEAPTVADGRTRFATEAARVRTALRLYRKVVSRYPGSNAARYAHLGIASILLADEKFAEATRELLAANEGLEDQPALEASVTEALGVSYLGQHKYPEATRAFESLGRIDRRRYRDVADYQLARTLFDRGDRDGAKTKLTALLARLDGQNAAPAEHAQDQARNLLRQIDPTALPAAAMPNGLPPDILRMLQQQGMNINGLGQ